MHALASFSGITRKANGSSRHLSNEGVEETPPSLQPCHRNRSSTQQSLDPKSLFVNLEGCNVGFKHFHPVPITQNGNKLSGQAAMGGCWEWTSSVLEKQQGFEAMGLYPAYTGKITQEDELCRKNLVCASLEPFP